MSLIKTAETTIKGWLKPIPHLPTDARKWLGENVWWIVGIGAAVSAIGALMGIYGYIQAQKVMTVYGSYFDGYVAGAGGAHYSLGWTLTVLLPIAFTIVTAILLARAVKPLQLKQKAGWNILFLVLLVEVVYVILNAVFTFDIVGFIFSLIFGAIGLALSAYVTFEIEPEFEHHAKKIKKIAKK